MDTSRGCKVNDYKDLWKKLAFVGTNFDNADFIYIIIIMMLILILTRNIRYQKIFTCIKYFQLMVQEYIQFIKENKK